MAHHNVSIMADLFHLSQHDGSASFPVSHWGLWKINRLTNTHTKSPPFAFPTLFCSILSLVLLDSTVISPISSSCFCEVNISNHPWDAHCLRPSQFLLLRLSSPPPFFFSCVLFLCTSISLCGASPHTTPTNSPSPLIVQLFSLFCHLFQPLWLAHCLSCSIYLSEIQRVSFIKAVLFHTAFLVLKIAFFLVVVFCKNFLCFVNAREWLIVSPVILSKVTEHWNLGWRMQMWPCVCL